MGLIACPECNARVSDAAAACPHCGYPIARQDATNKAIDHGAEASAVAPRKGGGWAWFLGLLVAAPIVLIVGIYIRNKAVGPVGWAMDNTIAALKKQMKDPDSTVVRTSYVVQRPDTDGDQEIFICGIVDGRNSFGGYAGGTRFASRSTSSKRLGTFDTWDVQMEDPQQTETAHQVGSLSGFEKVYWNAWCVDAQHPAIKAPAGN